LPWTSRSLFLVVLTQKPVLRALGMFCILSIYKYNVSKLINGLIKRERIGTPFRGRKFKPGAFRLQILNFTAGICVPEPCKLATFASKTSHSNFTFLPSQIIHNAECFYKLKKKQHEIMLRCRSLII